MNGDTMLRPSGAVPNPQAIANIDTFAAALHEVVR